MCVRKETPAGQHYAEGSRAFPGTSAGAGASLKRLCSTACSVGNAQGELEDAVGELAQLECCSGCLGGTEEEGELPFR